MANKSAVKDLNERLTKKLTLKPTQATLGARLRSAVLRRRR